MKRAVILFIWLTVALTFVPVFSQSPRINIPVKGLYPEGTVYDQKSDRFFVSSVADGTVGTVDKQGNYKKFYEDNSLKSTYGMKIDAKKNCLWVCVSDANYSSYSEPSTFKKTGRLIALDLQSGKKLADIDLAKLYKGEHFINDLTFDDKGNMYVTDSYSPVIYKVTENGHAGIFVQNALFKGEDVGLNGIIYHPAGFLLVDDGREGAVYKIPVNSPTGISKVKINSFFPGCDGLILSDPNTLVLIQNKSVDKVFQLKSTDDWQTATVKGATATEDRFQQPSTGTMADGKIYVLNSKLNELSDRTKKPSAEFSLQQVVFRPVR